MADSIDLNDLLRVDPHNTSLLVSTRIAFAPEVDRLGGEIIAGVIGGRLTISPLGLVNGVLGLEHSIRAIFDEDGTMLRFEAIETALPAEASPT